MAKKRGKEIKVPIPEDPICAAGPIDGPTYVLKWSIPIIEEKFTIVFINAKVLDINLHFEAYIIIFEVKIAQILA